MIVWQHVHERSQQMAMTDGAAMWLPGIGMDGRTPRDLEFLDLT